MEAKHTATFELPQHPHPAAQNDAERVIEIDGERAIVVVKALEGYDAERIAKHIVSACNEHGSLASEIASLKESGRKVIASEMERTQEIISLREVRDDLIDLLRDISGTLQAHDPTKERIIDTIAKSGA